jgi:dTDP-glucose 4,6-dehydratase
MASLLIIGGSGFFGKSILDAFQRKLLDPWAIEKVVIMARHPQELQTNYPQLITKNITLIKGDISSVNELPFADFVIHAAASTDARHYLERPIEERSNIISGALNYCKLSKEFHQKAKIVYVSSGAVYGMQPSSLNKIPENFQFLDPDQLPVNKRGYAYAKRDSEEAFIALGLNELNVSIARCFAFIGPWLPLDQHFAIGNFINDGLNNRKIKVIANKKVYRSYMYADDLVEWLMTIAEKSNSSCPIYNVGSDQEILINDLASKVGDFFHQEIEIMPHSYEDVDRYIPDISRAMKDLDLYLKYNLDEAISNTIENLKKNLANT